MIAQVDLRRLVDRSKNITILVHRQPDGDALGSAIALATVLAVGRQVNLVCATEIPVVFRPIIGSAEFVTNFPVASDLLIILDCSESHRTGFATAITQSISSRRPIVVIDHHQPGDLHKVSDWQISQPTASSTAEILADCFNDWRFPVNAVISQLLLLGIYTDTGGFYHANTSAKTLKIISRLIRHGADPGKIRAMLSGRQTVAKIRLWGLVASEVAISRAGVAIAKVTAEHLTSAGATADDINGLVNRLVSLEGVKIGLVMVETQDGWRCSLRTKNPNIDVGKLARYFGGSGQKRAAGFMFQDLIPDA